MTSQYTDLYRRLVRLRMVEEIIVREYPKQQIRCPMHLCLGQEAISAGATAALSPHDMLLGTHRSHGPYIASYGDLTSFFHELYGKEGGCCNGRGGSMHLIDKSVGFMGSIPIVASSIPIATGFAFSFKMQKKEQVSMIIFGEGATEEGVFHESVQYAVLKKLPIIYVCENNKFSVNTPFEERRPKDFIVRDLANAHGAFTAHGDGNNILEVNSLTSEAVNRAKSGNGPSFLEFDTYRWMEHCGPYDDHHFPSRSIEDFKAWKQRCPVTFAEKQFIQLGVQKLELKQIYDEEKKLVELALESAQNAPFPQKSTASLAVYA